MPYVVMIDEHFHSRDEGERYKHGEFADGAVAVEHCRTIVDEFLATAHSQNPGISAGQLFECYGVFGEGPLILSIDAPEVRFDAFAYAKARCQALCGDAGASGPTPRPPAGQRNTPA